LSKSSSKAQVAYSCPSSESDPKLPGTKVEIDIIHKHLQDFPVLQLLESRATVENVMAGMGECSWVHFACHGVQNIKNTTESALLLAADSQLTLSKITKLSLPHAELAFLSACQTATGTEDLAEEAVYLAAGMLLAGYHGVIATMWSIQDADGPKVADEVYGHLFKLHNPMLLKQLMLYMLQWKSSTKTQKKRNHFLIGSPLYTLGFDSSDGPLVELEWSLNIPNYKLFPLIFFSSTTTSCTSISFITSSCKC
jgi:CHAT domain